METVAALGEAVLSGITEVFFENLKSSDLIKFAAKKEELKRLEKKLRSIDAVLRDAEEKQVTTRGVRILLKDLKVLADDVNKVLEEFAHEDLRRKSTAKNNCLKWWKCNAAFNMKMGSKIKEITSRMEEIATDKTNLGLGEHVGEKTYNAGDHKRPLTTSLVTQVNVCGRGSEKDAIIKSLLVEQISDGTQVPVINVTGMTGIGKTTLAQLVYNDPQVKAFFDSRAWIHVSEDFDAVKITRAILHVVNAKICDTDDLNLLQLKLMMELSGKKFLLVLDDLWHQKYEDWRLLIKPFEDKNSECKIIITTQNQNVAQITGLSVSHPPFPLKELADDDCLSILAYHALGRKNFEEHQNLKGIGNDIVKKCKGLPSAVRALAGILRNKLTCEEWKTVSRSRLWDLIGEQGGVAAALGFSYRHLPSHLKPCFAYCSLIPKGYEFDRDQLVLLWIAEGFVQPKGSKQPEELGRKYFSDLLSRSFFQPSNNNKSLFVMPDLLIDLAQSVAGDFCFNMEEQEQNISGGQSSSEMARHVSFIPHQYDVSQRFENFNMKCLRSFLALPTSYQRGYCYLSSKVSQELLPKFKCLRVLSLSGYFIQELPSSIGKLKHLHSLNLSKTPIRLLPQSIGSLLLLQVLILNQCKELTALTVEICKLRKLSHLDIKDTPKLQELPSGLRNLTGLRILPKFIVGKAGGLALKELKDLSLQGHLSIIGLHNAVDIQDAKIANLKQKHGLKELALEWSNGDNQRQVLHNVVDVQDAKIANLRQKDGLKELALEWSNDDNQRQVLESLQPPKDLQKLSISYYGATKLPFWIGSHFCAKIEQLDLFDCINCKSLPPLGQLPTLRSLNMRGMRAVTKLDAEFFGNGFPSLEMLRFENMTEWKEWISSVGNIQGFPRLCELILHNCPRLTGMLPRTLGSLVKLDVQNCPRLTSSPLSFPFLGELTMKHSSSVILRSAVGQNITILKIEGISDLTCIIEELSKALTELEVLEVEGCSELTCLWRNGAELQNLPRLKSLVVKRCPKLVSLVAEEQGQGQGLCFLSSLTDIRIDSCQNLVSLPATGLPSTLKCLTILDCKALESLPDMNGCNSQRCLLEELEIAGCPLVSFPKGKFLSTLKSLRIANCNNLKRLPNGMVDGVLPLPHLKVLRISDCMNLGALPNPMWDLNSLQELSLSDCAALTLIPEGGLPANITSLEFSNCKNLKQPMSGWGLDRLNFLTELKIVGTGPATDIDSFPYEGVTLPPTLTSLCLENLDNLNSLSSELENLVALQELQVKGCSKLRFLPKTGLPVSLGRLCISGCPVLRDKCRKGKGEYWSTISDIPRLEID